MNGINEISRAKTTSYPKNFISVGDLDNAQIYKLFERCDELICTPRADLGQMARKTVALLFFQPSTRTRLGFASACADLGATAIGFESLLSSRASDATAETVADTVRAVSELCDMLVIRHFASGMANVASSVARVPVINAGDGTNEHPCQALSDIRMMDRRLGGILGKTIGIIGDPGARVLRSVILGLVALGVGKLLFLIPPTLPIRDEGITAVNVTLPADISLFISKARIQFDFVADIESLLRSCDAIEMMPVNISPLEAEPQGLKFKYQATPERFRLTRRKIIESASHCLIFHPGPRSDELDADTDDLENSMFRTQVREGHYFRMAIMDNLWKSE
jgi:aspartate carbamoyltransferase catalytic subunit